MLMFEAARRCYAYTRRSAMREVLFAIASAMSMRTRERCASLLRRCVSAHILCYFSPRHRARCRGGFMLMRVAARMAARLPLIHCCAAMLFLHMP